MGRGSATASGSTEGTTGSTTEPTVGSTTDTATGSGTSEGTSTTEATGTTGAVAQTEIRVMHLGVGVADVDVFVNQAADPTIEGLSFRDTNTDNYLLLDAGTYSFQVAATGSAVRDAVIDTGELELAGDTLYTAVAVGDAGDDGETALGAILLTDDGADIDEANVRIQVIHAAPGLNQEVDIRVTADDSALLTGVGYLDAGTLESDLPVADLNSLSVCIDVNTNGNCNNPGDLISGGIDITGLGGQYVNIYAHNNNNGAPVLVLQLQDGTTSTVGLTDFDDL